MLFKTNGSQSPQRPKEAGITVTYLTDGRTETQTEHITHGHMATKAQREDLTSGCLLLWESVIPAPVMNMRVLIPTICHMSIYVLCQKKRK